ncbi:MAG TPA: hypothetical protein VFX86_02955, partial [Candidatus Saccharimonadales bacterium]|nr:hypothetical protein [Candidatus Saccharimonadales bacterium]
PFTEVDDLPPKSALFYLPEDAGSVIEEDGKLSEADEERFHELAMEQERHRPLAWTSEDIVAPAYNAMAAGVGTTFCVVASAASPEPEK